MNIVGPRRIAEPDDILFLCPAARARKYLTIDLSATEWISPLGVVALLSTCLAASQRQLQRVTVVRPASQVVADYVEAVGFVSELVRRGWEAAMPASTRKSGGIGAHVSVMPLTTERDIEVAAERLHEALAEAGIAGNVFAGLLAVASELSGNAREHGSDCYLVAQTHSGRTSGTPGVHMAVADFGPGFAARLQKRYGKLTDESATLRAFEEGVSGTGQPDRGFGLGFVLDAIDGHKGARLDIVSRSAHVSRSQAQFVCRTVSDFKGTLATAYFPFTVPSL